MTEVINEAINEVSVSDLQQRIINRENLVVNIIADWCPDCTEEQRPHLPAFVQRLQAIGLSFYNLKVQVHKGEFISSAHEKITESFGGHGYPRTVLIVAGEVRDNSAVEYLDGDALAELVKRFDGLL